MKEPTDQTKPLRPGFVRIPNFMDVAVYDDAAFIDYIAGNRFWEHMLGIPQGRKQDARWREAHFNSEHFENSFMGHQWNEFVAKRKLLLALKEARYALDPSAALLERGRAGNKDAQDALKAAVEAIAYAEGRAA